MEQAFCERCGRNHQGSYGEYWYGTTDPQLKILGHERVFICNNCFQDTLLREELWLSAILGFSASMIYGLCNFFLLHPERLPVGNALALFEIVQAIALLLLFGVLGLFAWNMTCYTFRIPIFLGWLRLTLQPYHHIRDLLAISMRPYTRGYARFTRSQRARLK